MRQRSRRLVTYGKRASIQSQERQEIGPEASSPSHANMTSEATSAQTPQRPSSRATRPKERSPTCRPQSGDSISRSPVEDVSCRQDAIIEHRADPRIKRRRTMPGRNKKAPDDRDNNGLLEPPHQTVGDLDVNRRLEDTPASGSRVQKSDASRTRHGGSVGCFKPMPARGNSPVGMQRLFGREDLFNARDYSRYSDVDKADPEISPLGSHHDSNTTPTRRRLVDHLALTERPITAMSQASVESQLDEDEFPSTKMPESSSSELNDRLTTVSCSRLSRDMPETSQEPSPQVPTNLRGSKVTYARQRSFLNDVTLMKGDEALSYMVQSPFPPVSASKIPPYADDDETNDSIPVRSIHELRQSGDNARFRETVDSIFEEIEDSGNLVSERCTGFIQLCEKLLEREFVCRFSEYGFDERLVKTMTNDLDLISASLALCAYKIACNSGTFSFALSSSIWPRLLTLAPALLGVEEDLSLLLKQRSDSLSRATRASLKKLLPKLSSAVCGTQMALEITPRFLILSSIRHVLQKLRENGSAVEPLSASLISQHIQLLSPETFENQSPPLSSPHSRIFVLVFSILETYTVLSGPLDIAQCISFRPLGRLHSLLHADQTSESRQILDLYVRVILNLTNKDLSLCDAFATPQILSGFVRIITAGFSDMSGSSSENASSSLNAVILALGALINLAEKSDSSRVMFLTSTYDSLSILRILLRQFSISIGFVDQAHSEPEVHHNVALGYLSILLVTICLNADGLSIAHEALGYKGLELILSTSEEFLRHYQRVEKDSHPFGGREEGGSSFTGRLDRIICQVRQRHLESS